MRISTILNDTYSKYKTISCTKKACNISFNQLSLPFVKREAQEVDSFGYWTTNVNTKKNKCNIKFKHSKTLSGVQNKLQKYFDIFLITGFKKEDLDVANWITHGLINVSNKTNGNFVRSICDIHYCTLSDETLASAMKIGPSGYTVFFNKGIYDNIDKNIEEHLQAIKDDPKVLYFKNDVCFPQKPFDNKSVNEIVQMINRYKKGKMSFEEKVSLYKSIQRVVAFPVRLNNQPSDVLKELGYDISQTDKLSHENQLRLIKSEFHKGATVEIKKADPFIDVYHEICHTRDIKRHKPVETYPSPDFYPDILKQWFKNEKDLKTAYSVSAYARNGGPDEFIAETFARIMAGEKLSDDVYKLYRKYHGPRFDYGV